MSAGAKCRTCGAAIRWVVTTGGARMPLDPTAIRTGGVFIMANGRARVLSEAERARAQLAGHATFVSHHATCPGAGRHRVSRAQTAMDVGA